MGYIRDARLSSGYANGNTVHGMAEEIRLTDEDSISETIKRNGSVINCNGVGISSSLIVLTNNKERYIKDE